MSAADGAAEWKEGAMRRFGNGAIASAAAAILVIGLLAPAALAHPRTKYGPAPVSDPQVASMQPFSDGSWTPQGQGDGTAPYLVGRNLKGLAPLADGGRGIVSMQPFNDGGWTPVSAGVPTMQPFSDPNWTPEGTGVFTMRPFSDPNAIGHVPAVTAVAQPEGGSSLGSRIGITAGVIAGLLALLAAAGYASRQRRVRPA
jgi:hypothetical protein